MDAETKISKAKLLLFKEQPFFASLAFEFPLVECDDIPTWATEGTKIMWNRDFTDPLTVEETAGLIVHELHHIVFLHCHAVKKATINHQTANIAMDAVINDSIRRDMRLALPDGGIDMPEYSGWLWEEAYKDLLQNPDKMPQPQNGAGGWGDGDVHEAPAMSDAQKAEQEAAVKAAVGNALQQAKQKGKGTGSGLMDTLVDSFRDPKVDWKEFLQATMVSKGGDEMTWARPNRRHLHSGLYMPTTYSNTIGKIVALVDTSGSVDDDELTDFISELAAIHEEFKPSELHIVNCDYNIGKVDTFEPEDDLTEYVFTGRGGTYIQPALDYVKTLDDVVQVIVFSDGDFGYDDWDVDGIDADFLSIWSRKAQAAPVGDTVFM